MSVKIFMLYMIKYMEATFFEAQCISYGV